MWLCARDLCIAPKNSISDWEPIAGKSLFIEFAGNLRALSLSHFT